jgi:PAS domain S-box-containing protein
MCKDRTVIDFMVEGGWLERTDIAHLTYFAERAAQRHGEVASRHVTTLAHDVRSPLATGGDSDFQRSLSGTRGVESSQPAPTVEFAPQTRDRYELLSAHAHGGIGQVWVARENDLDRNVALKELRPEHRTDPQAKQRFLREARITGQLEHPGVTPVYELGWRDADQRPFYTMRFVKGPTLSEAVGAYHQRRRAGVSESKECIALLNAFVAVCNTVAYAHSRQVVHRDLKSQNVVLGEFGEVIVLDWGLAKLMRDTEAEGVDPGSPLAEPSTDEALVTMAGQALGTPAYMAPEQAAGRLDEIDHRTDIYGLGAMLYEILTGQPPFAGDCTRELLRKVQSENPVRPRDLVPDVPHPLEAACLRALAKAPKDRFSSARDLAQTVEQWQETERKAAEEALRASEALYHSLVETIPMNVWRKDADGRFTFANNGFCRASGRTIDELLGKTDFDLFPRELAEKYRHDDEAVMATGEIVDFIEEHVTGQGERLDVRVIKLPIRDAQGHIVGTQGIFWDVSESRRLVGVKGETPDIDICRGQSQAKPGA